MGVKLTSSVGSARSRRLGFGICRKSGSGVFRGHDLDYDVLHDRPRDLTLSEFGLEFILVTVFCIPK